VRSAPEFQALLANPPPQPAMITPVPYVGKAPVAATAASREAEQIVAEVYGMLARVGYTRENLAVAEGMTKKATDLAPDSARAWAVRARVQAAYLQRTWDVTAKRREDAQMFATRALSIAPDEANAMIAQAWVAGVARSEAQLRRALGLRPADPLVRRMLAASLQGQRLLDESEAMCRETVRLFPDDALAHYDLGLYYTHTLQDPVLALASFDAALAIEPIPSALATKAMILAGSRGDLAAARRTLELIAPGERSEDRAVSFAMWVALLENKPERVQEMAALSARPYFEDTYFVGPKAWMRALAHRREGKEAMARLQWEAAETVVRARLQVNPTGIGEKFELGVTLCSKGSRRRRAAGREPRREEKTLYSSARDGSNVPPLPRAFARSRDRPLAGRVCATARAHAAGVAAQPFSRTHRGRRHRAGGLRADHRGA